MAARVRVSVSGIASRVLLRREAGVDKAAASDPCAEITAPGAAALAAVASAGGAFNGRCLLVPEGSPAKATGCRQGADMGGTPCSFREKNECVSDAGFSGRARHPQFASMRWSIGHELGLVSERTALRRRRFRTVFRGSSASARSA